MKRVLLHAHPLIMLWARLKKESDEMVMLCV
jgi:hypothetical protein